MPTAVLVSFALATALVLATRVHPSPRPIGARTAAIGLGALAGFASYPAWIALIATIGAALGLEAPAAPPAPPGALLAGATVLLAPVFEEILYRERLLGALRRRFGAAAAVLVSSAAFAVAHVEPWAVLGTFLVGLALGAVMCLSGTVTLCIGLHVGLNLAAWLAA
jgi:membrane protease YdiL (CAAX protease family)